ncbi:hypothetical protein [Paenarthrobacter sp. NPDC018779]|uniref:hypothetical protein n=1 Tax=Paenarthrobacter sp. NPDC018779 TaxID=3364375 RepID=UPI0037C63BAE
MTDIHISAFLDERVVQDPTLDDSLDLGTLYGLYVSWCLTAGQHPAAQDVFCTALRHHGVAHDDEQGLIRVYPGLRILDPFTDSDAIAGAAASP